MKQEERWEEFLLGCEIKMEEFNRDVNITKTETNKRINTGINRLDELISGGFPHGSITLISGTPGSGKTILCYHYLWQGLENGENCLYLTSDERVDNIIKTAIDWDVTCGVARRAWAANENSLETAQIWNREKQEKGHITIPFTVKNEFIEKILD